MIDGGCSIFIYSVGMMIMCTHLQIVAAVVPAVENFLSECTPLCSLVNQTVFSACACAFRLVGGGNAAIFLPPKITRLHALLLTFHYVIIFV